MVRLTVLTAVMFAVLGCTRSQPNVMLPPSGIPEDQEDLHPWIADLLDRNMEGVNSAIRHRLSQDASPELAPLIACVAEFVPRRIEWSQGTGYVLCVKRVSAGRPPHDVREVLYIAQPLPPATVEERVAYFDAQIQSLMREFFAKFSGCGEEMEGCAGQFVLNHWCRAEEIAYYEPDKLGPWKDARLLYAARNGDSVFINREGATAWHVMEVNEIVPLFDCFTDFIRHYAQFRQGSEVFDSWASREYLRLNPDR